MTCEKCGQQRPLAFKSTCWACYQRERRSKLAPKRVQACVPERRYHAYDLDDNCKWCGAKRVFA